MRQGDVPPGALPVTRDFPKADYVEFGWGDDAYYRAPRPTKGMALKAVLWPTPSVLHVTDAGKPPVRFDEGRSETVIGLRASSTRPLRLLY